MKKIIMLGYRKEYYVHVQISGNNNLEDFCLFSYLKDSIAFSGSTINSNGIEFQDINEPLGYKIIIPPKVKIEIAKNFNFFEELNVWSENHLKRQQSRVKFRLN